DVDAGHRSHRVVDRGGRRHAGRSRPPRGRGRLVAPLPGDGVGEDGPDDEDEDGHREELDGAASGPGALLVVLRGPGREEVEGRPLVLLSEATQGPSPAPPAGRT